VADCSCALELDENYLKALLRRAKCYMDLGDFEQAVRDYEKAYKMDKNGGNVYFLVVLLSAFVYILFY
jgi:DnaJ family protein C protein 7